MTATDGEGRDPHEAPPGDAAIGGRDSFARYREQMAAAGFRPSTSRGQNLLLDPSLHRWITEQAAPGPDDTVVEIGVGLGFLTRELAALAGRLLAVEIEPRLLAIAQRELAACSNIEWLEADALGGPGGTLAPRIVAAAEECAGRLLVVANLPYSTSGPMLAETAQLGRLPDRIVVLVQKELGQRLVAGAGSDAYGSLSALLQSLFTVRLLRDVSPGVFRPRPKVWSAVVALERRVDGDPRLDDADARRQFARFVRQLFQQRRKTLRTTFALAAAGIGSDASLPTEFSQLRAEQLTPAQLVGLWGHCATREGC